MKYPGFIRVIKDGNSNSFRLMTVDNNNIATYLLDKGHWSISVKKTIFGVMHVSTERHPNIRHLEGIEAKKISYWQWKEDQGQYDPFLSEEELMDLGVTKYPCQVCDKMYLTEEPERCCSGYECGCGGQPTEPMVCSKECYDELLKPKRIIKKGTNVSDAIQALMKPAIEIYYKPLIEDNLFTEDEINIVSNQKEYDTIYVSDEIAVIMSETVKKLGIRR